MANKKSNTEVKSSSKNLNDLKTMVENNNLVSNPTTAATAEAKPKKKLLKKKASKKEEATTKAAPIAEKAVKAMENKKNKKEKAIKETATAQAVDLIEKVISNREVKWKYPEDVIDSLARKSWRQKQRNKIHKMERELARIQDQNSKEYKAKLKELRDFQKEVLKAAV